MHKTIKLILKENLAKPYIALLSLFIAVLYINLGMYLLLNFPQVHENACLNGTINFFDVSFFVLSGLLLGVIVNLQFVLAQNSIKISGKQLGFVSTGSLLASFSLVCGLCTLPILGIAVLNTVVTFLGTYNIIVRILSILLLGVGVYLSWNQLNKKCILGVCSTSIS